jgi:hypothetical protein
MTEKEAQHEIVRVVTLSAASVTILAVAGLGAGIAQASSTHAQAPASSSDHHGDDETPYGIAEVHVDRHDGNGPVTWATYSTTLGSPVGDTTSGPARPARASTTP